MLNFDNNSEGDNSSDDESKPTLLEIGDAINRLQPFIEHHQYKKRESTEEKEISGFAVMALLNTDEATNKSSFEIITLNVEIIFIVLSSSNYNANVIVR